MISIWKALLVIALVVSVVGLTVLVVIYVINIMSLFDFGIVIDAGSTSSKCLLYTWASNKYTFNAKVLEVNNSKASPGISSGNQSFSVLKRILDNGILQRIPQELRSRTTIFLGATAGMRMLKITDKSFANQIMSSIFKLFKKNYRELKFNSTDVKIISGADEGLYGWIAANYIGKMFAPFSYAEETYGALDMGGASAQVTFAVPANPTTDKYKSHYKKKLFGKLYTVYSHSYLCYGKTQAQYRYIASLFKDRKFTTITVESPCFPDGVTMSFLAKEIFTAPCVSGEFAIETFGSSINPPQSWLTDNLKITVIGKYKDLQTCTKPVKSKLFQSLLCPRKPCAINGIYQPALKGKFQAFASFKFLRKNLNPKNRKLTKKAYYNSLALKCKGNSTAANKKLRRWDKWICFDSAYMLEYLTQIGFVDNKWNMLEFANATKNYMGWGLGYIIDKTGILPRRQPTLPISTKSFIVILITLMVVALFAVVFLLRYLKAQQATKHYKYDKDEERGSSDVNYGEPIMHAGISSADGGVSLLDRGVSSTERGASLANRGISSTERGTSLETRAVSSTERGSSLANRGISSTQHGSSLANRGISTTQRGISSTQRGSSSLDRGVSHA